MIQLTLVAPATAEHRSKYNDICMNILKSGRGAVVIEIDNKIAVYCEPAKDVTNEPDAPPSKSIEYLDISVSYPDGTIESLDDMPSADEIAKFKEFSGKCESTLRTAIIFDRVYNCRLCAASYQKASNGRCYKLTGNKIIPLGRGIHGSCCPVCIPKLRSILSSTELTSKQRLEGGGYSSAGSPGCYRKR